MEPHHFKFKTLVVDDSPRVLEAISIELDDRAELTLIPDADTALNLVTHDTYDIVLTDYNLGNPDINGLQIFKRAQLKNPYVTACLMSGTDATPLLKETFSTFNGLLLEKPFTPESFNQLIRLAKVNTDRRNDSLGAKDELFSNIVAETTSMKSLIEEIKLCGTDPDLRIHLTGPSGSGKTMFAEIIHKLSRPKEKFVTVDCSTLGQTAISQLFGHVKGSFTGAFADHNGVIHEANGGTLFLDEFHLLTAEVQGLLLRVIDQGKYTRLGDKSERESHFRLITAASSDVQTLVKEQKFSRDLWFRATGKVLEVPSLAERKACIPKLVYRFLSAHGEKRKRSYEITPQAIDTIASFSWAGNIRDMHNCLEAACAQTPIGHKITETMVLKDLRRRSGSFDSTAAINLPEGACLKDAVKQFELGLITQALSKNRGNFQRTAAALKVPRGTLRTRCKILGIAPAR